MSQIPKIINRIPEGYGDTLAKEKESVLSERNKASKAEIKKTVKIILLCAVAFLAIGLSICASTGVKAYYVYIVSGITFFASGGMIGIALAKSSASVRREFETKYLSYKRKSRAYKKNKLLAELLEKKTDISAFSMTDSEVFIKFVYGGKLFCTILPYEWTYEEDLPDDVLVFYEDRVEGRRSVTDEREIYGTSDLFGTTEMVEDFGNE